MVLWLWQGDSILIKEPKNKFKYAFNCSTKAVRLLDTDFGRSGDDEWVIPASDTRADRWRKELCAKAQYF